MQETMTDALSDKEGRSTESSTGRNFQAAVQEVRHRVYAAADRGLSDNLISEKDAVSMKAGLDFISSMEELRGWQRFVNDPNGLSSQMRKYQEVRKKFDIKMSSARDIISKNSYSEWENRFRDSTYQQRLYFLNHQFDDFMKNWRMLVSRRESLAAKAKGKLEKSGIENISALFDKSQFKELSYRAKQSLIGKAEAALAVSGVSGLEALHKEASAMMSGAAGRNGFAKHRVGTWLQRIFAGSMNEKEIAAVVRGSGPGSLKALLANWERMAGKYQTVKSAYAKVDAQPMGFTPMSEEKFLSMGYDQCESYLQEARRVLMTANNVKTEEPNLLQIRHLLDIKDWEAAEDAIKKAQQAKLKPEDSSRLQSMRQFLLQHRDVPAPPMEKSKEEAVRSATNKLNSILYGGEMDEPMRSLTLKLVPHGAQAVNNLRWGVYNRVWCERNGYLNDEKAQKGYDDNHERSMERSRRGVDPGLHDAVETSEEILIRTDEQQKKAKVRATVQHVNISNEGAVSTVAEWYRDRDPKVLYWTTFQANKNGHTMDSAWHFRHFVMLCDVRSALRTLESHNVRYRGLDLSRAYNAQPSNN